MSDILALARPEIVALKAYSHAAWDPSFDRLHANELPWRAETDRSRAGLNRYPEPHPLALAARLAELYGVKPEQLLPGRGSDESIDLVVRGFCRAGVDNVIICPPTFGMYAVAARIQGAEVREVPLVRERGFALDADGVLAAADANTRVVFLCSAEQSHGQRTRVRRPSRSSWRRWPARHSWSSTRPILNSRAHNPWPLRCTGSPISWCCARCRRPLASPARASDR